jgi:hypothetical protein
LASLLGVHIQTAIKLTSRIRRDWTTYIAERVSTLTGEYHTIRRSALR